MVELVGGGSVIKGPTPSSYIYRDFGRGGSIGLFGDLRGLRGGLMWVFPLSRKTEIRTGDQEEDEKYRIGRQEVAHQILLQQMTPSAETLSWTVCLQDVSAARSFAGFWIYWSDWSD